MKPTKDQNIRARITTEEKEKILAYCEKNKTNTAELIRTAVMEYIEKQGKVK